MKTAMTTAIGIAVLVAIAGVAGLAFVAPGALTAPFGGSNPNAGSSSGGAGGNGGGSAGFGNLAVYVQDAPSSVNWSHVWVTFSKIQAHEANATNETGWFNVTVQTGTVDLAALKSVSQLLGTATLPAGMYTQLRIVVSSASGVMENGTKVDFVVPSGVLKTDDPFNVTLGQTTSLTFDIDLSRSIVHADGMWLFLPVISSVQET
jgi:Domain of unknown function (DUF4382)